MNNNNKLIEYVITRPDTKQVDVLFKSFFPMDEEEILASMMYEGVVREKGSVAVEKLTDDNKGEFIIPENCKILSNLND